VVGTFSNSLKPTGATAKSELRPTRTNSNYVPHKPRTLKKGFKA